MSVSRRLLCAQGGLPDRLVHALAAEGYATEAAAEAVAFRSRARSGRYALAFLRSPCPSGIRTPDALRDLRSETEMPCVVVATAPLPLHDKVEALEAGADEILDAAMPAPEAVARVRAVLRRARPTPGAATPGPSAAPPRGWRLSLNLRRIETPDGGSHRLTAAEFDLLRALAAASGEAVDRDAISRQVLRRPWRPDDRAVDGLVKRLRRKLGNDAVQTSRGLGYALAAQIHSE